MRNNDKQRDEFFHRINYKDTLATKEKPRAERGFSCLAPNWSGSFSAPRKTHRRDAYS